jgi:hypothetical protein
MSGGTIDAVAIEISKLLRPLESQLSTTAGARAFFAQMGFTLSDAQVSTVAAPFATLAGNTGDLIKITTAIIQAIEAEDYGTLTAKGIEAIQRIVQVVDAISTLGSSMAGLVALPADQIAKRILDYLVFVYLNGALQINDVLEFLGFIMDFGPVEAEVADEEKFDEAMAAEDVEGKLVAGGGELDTGARRVMDEAGIGEGFDHGGGGAGRDAERGGHLPHGYQTHVGRERRLPQVDRLDVVLDRARCQHGQALLSTGCLCANPWRRPKASGDTFVLCSRRLRTGTT